MSHFTRVVPRASDAGPDMARATGRAGSGMFLSGLCQAYSGMCQPEKPGLEFQI
jgi:hypothetical protein